LIIVQFQGYVGIKDNLMHIFLSRTQLEYSVMLLELHNDWLLSLNFIYILQNKIVCVCPSV